jgi:PIN domain nuclease of toxin-antitoxin system
LLIDTHALIWAVDDPSCLGTHAASALEDPGNELLFSAGSVWETSIKIGLGKLKLSLREWMAQAISELRMTLLPITLEHADVQSRLPLYDHRDPFDRLLAAQAQVEGLSLVSADSAFDQYSVARIW